MPSAVTVPACKSAEADCAGVCCRLCVNATASPSFHKRVVLGWHHTTRRIRREDRLWSTDVEHFRTGVVERRTLGVVGKQRRVAVWSSVAVDVSDVDIVHLSTENALCEERSKRS